MRISEVADRTGLNISNVRFYERKGLLTPDREEVLQRQKGEFNHNWKAYRVNITVALGNEMVNYFTIRDVKAIREMYEKIDKNTYTRTNEAIYERLGESMDYEKFALSLEQTEILYDLELYKTINDMESTVNPVMKGKIISLKSDWTDEGKEYMSLGFSGFIEKENVILHWYSEEELEEKIKEQNPAGIWFPAV